MRITLTCFDIDNFYYFTNLRALVLFYSGYVTVWWIKNVFCPNHRKNHGDVYCTLLLDNCAAHKYLDQDTIRRARGIPAKLIVIFLPPNVTCRYQPMDMGIIACIKVGYRMQLLRYFLQLFDEGGEGYEALEARRKNSPRGCKGSVCWRKSYDVGFDEFERRNMERRCKVRLQEDHAKLLD